MNRFLLLLCLAACGPASAIAPEYGILGVDAAMFDGSSR